MTGISLALGLCAAAWFTTGTRTGDVRGVLALCACAVTARAAGGLARRPGGTLTRQWVAAGLMTAQAGRLARVCSALSECAIVGGMAAGGQAAGYQGMWPLAITVIIAISVRETLRACYRPPPVASRPQRRADQLVAMPVAGRALLIAVTVVTWGVRAPLLALLVWSIISVTYAVFAHAPVPRAARAAARPASSAAAAPAVRPPVGLTGLAALLSPPAPAVAVPAVAGPGVTGPAVPGPAAPGPAAPGTAAAGAALAGAVVAAPAAGVPGRLPPGARALLRCRDDGRAALWLGKQVRGALIPLPPALAGVAAAAVLALLGLRDLPGSILLTPLVVMLLAAPGSSHPHDGRLDWVVPAVLQAGQYIYIATLGYAARVPAMVTFILCMVIAAWYADLAGGSGRRPRTSVLRSGLGWEGRMLAVGLGAILGIATFAYLALTAYLVVLICWRLMTSCLPVTEGDRR
ncbi:MAG: DUF5941 domain-containing protein [Streptosporangiaceae bacterium]